MTRLHIPGLVDILRLDQPDQIVEAANDPRLDRNYIAKGPLLNRIVAGRIRKVLQLDGAPLPPVSPRGADRPLAAQAQLEARLNALTTDWSHDDPSIKALADYVRGQGDAKMAGPLAQQAVGRLYNDDYIGDDRSWAAALVLAAAPRTFNPFLLIWWALTGRVNASRRLLAGKVGGDPSGLHGTGVAIHNIVAGLVRMRGLWADRNARHRLSAEAAAAQCLVAPGQVVRQPLKSGEMVAGDFKDTTLVLLQLDAAHQRDPTQELAFMTQSWSRCPAHAWVPALLVGVWRAALKG
jgi:hypothetical protein